MTGRRNWIGAAFLAIAAMGLASAAKAAGTTDLAHLHAGEPSRTPIGWAQFCADNPSDCRVSRSPASAARLDDRSWSELLAVNLKYNKAIEPVTDQDQFGVIENWGYATSGKGDCEDYVLEKRRELIRRGWPMSALLITVVIDKEGGGHAVLTVVTDRGEFILDNQTDKVLPWSKSGLTFIRRQSPADQNVWLDLGRLVGRPDVVTAAIAGAR
ncbi:MAG TPA: transglutaminase-like cysteine peptidase [Bosea sp. (in: a-proteobacteria)]|jgi:predicted transglutaminase-like cysteine proteinase|uniref:transglutaminase-like cysteine peptidase n=1 Tax=Bosea sp. (in: a-proteobacteria) TaxID=1871050 RepID=UPI002E13429B|nr:transglutaminase-like cysteine peptidase [Bosea sp. (in: a-proteobacteria)]